MTTLADYSKTYNAKEVHDFPDDLLLNPSRLHRVQYFTEMLKKYGGESVMDVGCHTGIMSLYLAANGFNVTGIDIQEKAIKFCNDFCEKHKIKAVYQCAPFETYNGEMHDWVIAAEIFEHVLDEKKFLEFCTRNGRLVFITTPDYYGEFGYGNPGDTEHEHLRILKYDEFINLISRYGKILEVNQGPINYIVYKPMAFYRVLKNGRFGEGWAAGDVVPMDWEAARVPLEEGSIELVSYEKPVKEEVKEFKCECGKSFKNQGGLNLHKRRCKVSKAPSVEKEK